METVYAKVDDFIQIIKQKGKGCLLFKKDLRKGIQADSNLSIKL